MKSPPDAASGPASSSRPSALKQPGKTQGTKRKLEVHFSDAVQEKRGKYPKEGIDLSLATTKRSLDQKLKEEAAKAKAKNGKETKDAKAAAKAAKETKESKDAKAAKTTKEIKDAKAAAKAAKETKGEQRC